MLMWKKMYLGSKIKIIKKEKKEKKKISWRTAASP